MSSCTKHIHCSQEDKATPIGFNAMSQSAEVKSEDSLAEYYENFGVWGIARHPFIASPYILWNSNSLTEVRQSTSDQDNYFPVSDAYWLAGYSYDFVAVAPYGDTGIADLSISQKTDDNTIDALSFSCDLSSKYTESVYDFDLLGAAASTDPVSGGRTDSQQLTFRHLFTKIVINVIFIDASGAQVDGSVSEIRLRNVGSKVTYTLGSDNDGLSVSWEDPIKLSDLTFSEFPATVLIHPQTITDFELYLDFTRDNTYFQDFKINLNAGPQTYGYNESYNWKIIISPKEDISFSVEVAPWGESVNVGDEIPII